MNPKSGSSSTAASPVREGGGGRMDKGHKPKRLYQVWKGSNIWKFGFFWGSNLILLIMEVGLVVINVSLWKDFSAVGD